jgi:hypothetical protein
MAVIYIQLQNSYISSITAAAKNCNMPEAISFFNPRLSGFGGLGVACWPLVPKFAGSNPVEAV